MDNNCNGFIDEGLPTPTQSVGDDGDGYGGIAIVTCQAGPPYVTNDLDCDDEAASTYPGAPDVEGDNVDSSGDNQDSLAPRVGLVTSTFTSIQAALDSAAEGDILWVGPGTYLEFGLSMNGKGLTLASTAGAETTVIDAQSQGSVMVFDHGADETSKVRLQGAGAAQTVVDGRQDGSVVIADSATLELKRLTLMNGNASSGGGLEARQNLGMLSNVTFSANSASHGGGLSLSSSYPTFNQVSLIGNSAGDGGGM